MQRLIEHINTPVFYETLLTGFAALLGFHVLDATQTHLHESTNVALSATIPFFNYVDMALRITIASLTIWKLTRNNNKTTVNK